MGSIKQPVWETINKAPNFIKNIWVMQIAGWLSSFYLVNKVCHNDNLNKKNKNKGNIKEGGKLINF